ncbi:efflux RND transporter periplasmic adaptor subunit [Marinobacter halodurans]|uniref:Efflux RND transporter periplasmic adaptor subunit n=1 Tax=Marinobacter halodurans TaxID=2528979 RepID=A0ABY1ZS09_9GAMM|nr:efflux RND transporter periplasmic adaptor subunit [Marinobacter halodurans]TBW57971.1 efflux RND transporter periplasmic adaptor subunit [Marinobacter halodurans]
MVLSEPLVPGVECYTSSGWRSVAVLLTVASLLLQAGCSSSAEPAEAADPPQVVDTAVVQPADGGSQVTLSGRVKAAEQTSLSFEISGEIERLSVDVGDSFEAGDTLAVLGDARYQLVYDRAVASEKEAKAALDEARLAFDRQSSLREKGYTSQSQLDSAQAQLDSARSRYESAVASRRIAARDLRLTALKAPFTGSVSQRYVEPSERVSPNQTVLDVISDRDGFEVETSVPETLIGQLRAHSKQTITLPALDNQPVPATIKHVGTQPQSSNNYPVVLTLQQPVEGLRSGMTAQVHLQVGDAAEAASKAVRIPLTALLYDGDRSAHVLRLDADNRLEAVDLTVGAISGQQVAVTGNLDPGDRIVARGAEFVAPGDVVAELGQGPQRYN